MMGFFWGVDQDYILDADGEPFEKTFFIGDVRKNNWPETGNLHRPFWFSIAINQAWST
jgi:hypothetical protein|tara:strand:- start:305 stop:478 length:174 start_codon:yes stop_codon:yes gene_type:complete